MALPIVAIVGRPNVGKSTLVNRIAVTGDAIVHSQRGVTRDRAYYRADWNGRDFVLVDTGGIEANKDDVFQAHIKAQAVMAAQEADAIVFLVDGRTGVTEDDQMIAGILRKTQSPVFLAVNKMDNPADESAMYDFYALGLGDPWPVSATHGHGTGDILDAIVATLPADAIDDTDPNMIDVAIIGRPNAGKSSLANLLIGKERSIVSSVAGTTRDSIDTIVEHDGKSYRLVDTAGMRKKSAMDQDVEYYGYVRALRAVDRANVSILVIDSSVGVTDQDQRIAGMAKDRGCAMAVLLNKWDLLETDKQRDDIVQRLEEKLQFVSYAPVLRTSAATGRSVERVWGLIDSVYAGYGRKIPTSKINELLTELRDFGHTVVKGAQRLKVHYGTQTDVQPPEFTFFANAPELADDNYKRYLENRIRERFDLAGTPIKLRFRKKS